jgi:hypothetical protein
MAQWLPSFPSRDRIVFAADSSSGKFISGFARLAAKVTYQ